MILARAPLRISLGGGGTDLPSYYSHYGGFILSAAINKYVYVYVNRPAADDLIRVKYSRYEQVSSVDEITHDLVRPTLKLLNLTSGLEIVSMADVPDGTGLGSSGSYMVSLLTALHEFKRDKIPTQIIAEEACHVEMDLAGHPVGKHDHYLAAFGGITCLEIQKDGKVQVTPLNISRTTVDDLRSQVMIFFTGVTRSSRQILQEQKDKTQQADQTVVDSLHYTKELGYRIKEALEKGDMDLFGKLLDEHWENKKKRSGSITDGRIDKLYSMSKAAGAIGGKLIGAGGGGFLMIYCGNSAKAGVRSVLTSEGLREMPFDLDYEGAKVLLNV